MREIEDAIRQLKDIRSRASLMYVSKIDAAIRNLEEITNIRYSSGSSETWSSDSCPDCRPGRPCYGHGHY
jgi:hypothetical protein